jgi:hypothetical protein
MAEETYEGVMFKVEHLDPVLRERNGRYGLYSYKIAVKGEKAGKWKMLEGGHVGRHETRVLEAGGSGRYLVRTAFGNKPTEELRKQERVALGRSDLYGDVEEEADGKSGAK